MVSKISTLLGTVLLIAALSLWGYNQWEDHKAGSASSDHLAQLLEQLPPVTEGPLMLELDIPQVTEHTIPQDVQMQETTINGYAYIGYLAIPSLELELPIMSTWDYERLDVAPCRYYGTMKGEDLVLLAHNFPMHFGKIGKLEPGAEISFTDVEGTTYRYKVAVQESLEATATEAMVQSGYALTLFTCTNDSQSRVVVRCDLA